jgi:hypothetical protein
LIDVLISFLGHLPDDPGPDIPPPDTLPRFHAALTTLARDVLTTLSNPDYLAQVRVIIAESPHLPQIGDLWTRTVIGRAHETTTDPLERAHAEGVAHESDIRTATRPNPRHANGRKASHDIHPGKPGRRPDRTRRAATTPDAAPHTSHVEVVSYERRTIGPRPTTDTPWPRHSSSTASATPTTCASTNPTAPRSPQESNTSSAPSTAGPARSSSPATPATPAPTP